MKRLAIVGLLIFVGFAGWRVGGALSTDAMGMAVGIVFGVLASLPVALLMLAATRRSAQNEPPTLRSPAQPQNGHGQMPVVILAPPAYPGYGQQGYGQQGYGQPTANGYAQLPPPQGSQWAFPSPARAERVFTIVGEQDESTEEW